MTPAIDEEFARLVPRLSDDERERLEADIVRDGRAIMPLVAWNGVLLDGHNRLEICEAHGIPFEVIDAPACVVDRASARIWILRTSLDRRNLTPIARAQIATALEKAVKAEMAAKMRAGKGADGSGGRGKKKNPPVNLPEGLQPDAGRTARIEAAEASGMSEKTYAAAKIVLEKGTPELKDAVNRGVIGIDTAAVLTRLPPERQSRIAKQGKKAAASAKRSINEEVAVRNRVWNGEAIPEIVEAIDAGTLTPSEAYTISKFDIKDRQANELEKRIRHRVVDDAQEDAALSLLPEYQHLIDGAEGAIMAALTALGEIAEDDSVAALREHDRLRRKFNDGKKGLKR